MRALRFLPEAPDDIRAACQWYDSRRAGLGQEFLNELHSALGRVSETPEIYGSGYRDVRSARMRRFP